MDDVDAVDAVVDAYRRTCGRRVRTLREQRGLSLRAMAAQVGIGFVTLSELERGKFGASDGVKFRIARVLGVEPDELFEMTTGAAA